MKARGKAQAAEVFGDLTLASFRLNGLLLTAGDRLAADANMTSARWQVLGTLILAAEPLTVAAIARRMGLARQSVQRIADWLMQAGQLEYVDNPAHPRWHLARSTAAGRRTYRRLEKRRAVWAQQLVAGMDPARLQVACDVLQELRDRLHDADDEGV